MSASPSYDARTIKGKKPGAIPPLTASPSHSGPTTFFLRSEKDVERGTQRGRKGSRTASGVQDERLRTPSASAMGDSRYGVESLSDTINSAFPSDSTLSRTNSNTTEPGLEASVEGGPVTGRKRKAGNPVHPSIMATGQRILSAERLPTQASSAALPLSLRASESPYRSHLRRGSAASSLTLNSQPLTPLKMSPQPDSAMPSTPRSGSPKSFRLSDEESSVVDETGSQALQSSSGEDDEDADTDQSKDSSMPQLVMPSIAVSARRPFTDRGKRMGRLKAMVVGSKGVGKTSLIQSIFRSCEDIVHVDPASGSQTSLPSRGVDHDVSPSIAEMYASTRPYPPWWTDFEGRRMLLRRKSIGDGVLERNLCFIDTPGVDDEGDVQRILQYFDGSMQRTASLEKMTDSELISVLSGEGGVQIDVVLWMFASSSSTEPEVSLEGLERSLFETLCKCTNVVPIIGRADSVLAGDIAMRKQQVLEMIEDCGNDVLTFPQVDAARQGHGTADEQHTVPFAISSALSDDAETIDASILMSSQYVQPLVPSELGYLVEHLLDPENISRMRHLSATKFLLWRQQNLGHHIDLHKQTLLRSPQFGYTLPSVTSTGSILEEPSKVLVPHGSSSYYRSVSSSASDASAVSGRHATGASVYALAHYNEQTQEGAVPFRQVRLAKWAQDLQRGLEHERRRYQRMYLNAPLDWTSDTAKSAAAAAGNEKALMTGHHTNNRPPRGRLGGDIAVIDPRDPLGVLAFAQGFRRRGWFVLQVAGGCGLLGTMAWWVMRNWVEVQEWFGVGVGGEAAGMMRTAAVPPPAERGLMDWVEEVDWRGFLGWER